MTIGNNFWYMQFDNYKILPFVFNPALDVSGILRICSKVFWSYLNIGERVK